MRPRRYNVLAATVAALALSAGCTRPLTTHRAGPPAGPSGARPPVTTPAPPAASSLPWGSREPNKYLPDDVLIADAANNRILLVTPDKRIVWQMPEAGRPSPLRDDDDVFFGPHWDEIITNEEDHHRISIIDFKTRKIVWSYGHPGVPGAAPGFLNTPDDAFLYDRDGGLITAADIKNQRIVFIDRGTKRIVKQYGHTGVMRIAPPAYFSAPNGDFPAPDGGMLVTQINGNDAILLDRDGRVMWTLHFPRAVFYPSDANFTPDGNVICAFYTNPGAVVLMSPAGKLLWQYRVLSGEGRLNHPSLAVQLPNRMVLLNDDFNHRVIVIDPATNKIVWQYGHTGVAGSAAGYLNVPDGVDVLPPGITPGVHSPAERHLWSYPGNGY
jgi:putative pyrroloquinoline-quinone binding quinoprotein